MNFITSLIQARAPESKHGAEMTNGRIMQFSPAIALGIMVFYGGQRVNIFQPEDGHAGFTIT
jgi:hypothetical protein